MATNSIDYLVGKHLKGFYELLEGESLHNNRGFDKQLNFVVEKENYRKTYNQMSKAYVVKLACLLVVPKDIKKHNIIN